MIALPNNTLEQIILPRLAAASVALALMLGHSCDHQTAPRQTPIPAATPAAIDATDAAAIAEVAALDKIYAEMTDEERMRGVVYEPVGE